MGSKVNIIFSILALALFAVFVLVLPTDPNAETFENRAMEQRPQFSPSNVISGEFFKSLESYLLDNIALRTTWLTFANIVEHSYGLHIAGGARMVDFSSYDLGIGLTPLEEELTQGVDMTALRIGPINPQMPFSQDILFHEDAVFYLRYIENQTLAARYAEVLNAHKANIPDHVRMFSMLAPVKVEFMGERYAAVNSSQLDTINFVNSQLNEGIITVDAHSALAAQQDVYIFFRLDHHWTALGAYFAYHAFAAAAGFLPITIDNYVEYAIENFVGSLAVGTRNRTVLDHPDTIYFYKIDDGTTFSMDLFTIPANLADACYRIFMGGDRAFFYFTSSNLNGRTLVVVKDSFANALVPWIAPHYQTIVMVDPRQFVGSIQNILAEFDDIDLLFVNYLPATTMADLIEQIYDVR